MDLNCILCITSLFTDAPFVDAVVPERRSDEYAPQRDPHGSQETLEMKGNWNSHMDLVLIFIIRPGPDWCQEIR